MTPPGNPESLTSSTHPIRVDFLSVRDVPLRGRIGMTFAPGKKGPGEAGYWERDLFADLNRLRHVYNVSIVASLLETRELRELEMSNLFDVCHEVGLIPLRLPIVDGSVPMFVEDVLPLVDSIVDAARKGGNVVIHCRGGLGRTGLVAACCLVRLRQSPEAAIAAVRRARSGTIENSTQEAFVSRFADVLARHHSDVIWLDSTPEQDFVRRFADARKWYASREDPITAPSSPTLSAFRGCLLGGALGDALGYLDLIHFTGQVDSDYATFAFSMQASNWMGLS